MVSDLSPSQSSRLMMHYTRAPRLTLFRFHIGERMITSQ